MQRGGPAFKSSLCTGHPLSSIPCCPLLHRSLHPPASTGGASTRLQLRGPRSKQKKYLLMHEAVQHSAGRVFSLCRSGEANLGSKEMTKDKFLIDCEAEQECVLGSKEMTKDKFLIDCEAEQECVLGGIVALGKFDALHIGHRELAIQASKAGTPFLLSFIGIAEVLGWEPRPPVVANCDRKRVLSSWAPYSGNKVPLEYHVQFSSVRHLTPREFVERLSKELKISGVVAGANYRFGYKASGNAMELVRLCKEYGLAAFIVSPVMDTTQRSHNGAYKSINSSDKGQVSSTRVRHALAMGDMEYVAYLLGRRHRLVLSLDDRFLFQERTSVPKSCMLNQPPKDGAYNDCSVLLDDKLVGPANVVIDSEIINIELDCGSLLANDLILDQYHFIGIEFG